jgi:high-affinity nickel-transport protein
VKFLTLASLGNFPIGTTLVLGFVLGLKHALDADHLAAVSTFASEEKNPWRSSLIGAYWGLGHTAALLVFGMAIAIFRLVVPARVSQTLEFLVGVMLVVLGLNVIRKLVKGQTIHAHTHTHAGTTHSHLHHHWGGAPHPSADGQGGAEHGHDHHILRLGGRPFIVGVMHGLAGTAALMLLVIGAIPSLLLALGYILIFGVGSVGAMMIMSMLMSVPLALAARRLVAVERTIRLAAGLFSLGFGIFLAWDVGLIQSLLE